ncbi:Hypothetical protein UVM_LOCUS53 [uncultured virus]|nr:Hypothetical protein UVM_LOCUS53 [uncultured virus]
MGDYAPPQRNLSRVLRAMIETCKDEELRQLLAAQRERFHRQTAFMAPERMREANAECVRRVAAAIGAFFEAHPEKNPADVAYERPREIFCDRENYETVLKEFNVHTDTE